MLHRKLVLSFSAKFLSFRNFSYTNISFAQQNGPLISKLAIEKARPRTVDPKFDYSPARAKIFPRPNVPQEDTQRLTPQVNTLFYIFIINIVHLSVILKLDHGNGFRSERCANSRGCSTHNDRCFPSSNISKA